MNNSDRNNPGNGSGQETVRTVVRSIKRDRVPRPADRNGDSSPVKTQVRDRVSQSPTPEPSGISAYQQQERSERVEPSPPEQGYRQPDYNTFSRTPKNTSSNVHPLKTNRLVDEASSLLSLGGFLLGSDKPNDLELLRTEVHEAVSRYLRNIQDHYSESTLYSAGFCICAFIDDCVLRTLWGQESPWSESSILATEYNIAHRYILATQIKENIHKGADSDLFALYHTILSLGYVGMTDPHEIVSLKEDVYRKIKFAGHQEDLPLVSHSMIQAREGEPLARRLPWWTVLAGAIALTLLVYWVFWILLQPSVDDFHATLADDNKFKYEQLGPQDFFIETIQIPEIRKQVDIRQLLLDQGVSEDAFTLMAANPGTRIVLLADGMFSSGSANLETRFLPVLQSIGTALISTTGRIIVEGHTDNVPFSGALRTNRTLSEDRSKAVANVLAQQLDDSDRLSAKGRADLSPIVCNDSRENRNRNRRVELVLPDIETFGAEPQSLPVCDETG